MYTLPQVTCVQVKKWLNISNISSRQVRIFFRKLQLLFLPSSCCMSLARPFSTILQMKTFVGKNFCQALEPTTIRLPAAQSCLPTFEMRATVKFARVPPTWDFELNQATGAWVVRTEDLQLVTKRSAEIKLDFYNICDHYCWCLWVGGWETTLDFSQLFEAENPNWMERLAPHLEAAFNLHFGVSLNNQPTLPPPTILLWKHTSGQSAILLPTHKNSFSHNS